MENKKTIIGIIILLILIIVTVVGAYFYNRTSTEQINLLTDETNQLLQSDILKDDIDSKIKTEKNYAIVEKSIKEYLSKIKALYTDMQETNNEINPHIVFQAENVKGENFTVVDNIISNYKEKAQKDFEEYEELVKEENIINGFEENKITNRKEYYKNLYKTVMLSDVMKSKYSNIQEKIEKEKDSIIERANKLTKIKELLIENKKYWNVKEDKIQFTNIGKMTEYYNLINQLVD